MGQRDLFKIYLYLTELRAKNVLNNNNTKKHKYKHTMNTNP